MSSLSRQDVEKIAHLARLALTADEIGQYQEQLSAVLDYAAVLDTLDLSNIEPTAHVVVRQNVLREDVTEDSLALEDVLANAAQHAHDQFLIQSIFEE